MMRRRRGQRILIIIGAGLLLVILNTAGWLSPVHQLLGWMTRPVATQLTKAGTGTGNFLTLTSQVKNLAADNQRLESDNADLRQKLAEDAELRQQNEALRRQLNFSDSTPSQLLPAEVISYQPDNFRQFLTINRGRLDGLKEGMAVVAEGKQLVGKISEVGDHDAKVFLIIDPTFKAGGLDQDSRADGTIKGQIGTGLIMDKIAQNEAVKSGDTVITSGLGGDLPKGLIVGRVEAVNQQDNGVFQTAQVVSDLKLNKLELVFVVTS